MFGRLKKLHSIATPNIQTLEGTYAIVEDQFGTRYLQIDTYVSASRKMPGKKSKPPWFSTEAIKQLKTVIDKEY